jgi:hypothetical protein
LEIGAEWTQALGDALANLQAGLVAQTWHNASAPAVQQGEADLGFFGLTVTAELTY